ncbi:MAG: hypothetical protein KC912_04235 [Proteobacteria bacterium]|nr:hypothetical protein [Pseudomonadota bacterium]
MFRWLFGSAPAPTGPTRLNAALDTTPGTSVKTDDGLVGTLSAIFDMDGRPWARVIFCGHKNSWVELLDASQLILA